MSTWHIYVLLCDKGRFYCGIARDVEKRFAEHSAGRGARFTRAYKPKKVLATWVAKTHSDALKAEALFKKKSKRKKEQYVSTPKLFAKDIITVAKITACKPRSIS